MENFLAHLCAYIGIAYAFHAIGYNKCFKIMKVMLDRSYNSADQYCKLWLESSEQLRKLGEQNLSMKNKLIDLGILKSDEGN